jgi:hypothetical protein
MAAALLIGSGLATPYVLDYDLMVLAPAIALLAARGLAQGFVAWELSQLATLWELPLAARPLAEHTAIALTPIVPAMALVFIFASRQPTMPSAVATSATMATAYAQARSMLWTRMRGRLTKLADLSALCPRKPRSWPTHLRKRPPPDRLRTAKRVFAAMLRASWSAGDRQGGWARGIEPGGSSGGMGPAAMALFDGLRIDG